MLVTFVYASHSLSTRLTFRARSYSTHFHVSFFFSLEPITLFTTSLDVTSLWPRLSECQWVVPLLDRQELEKQRQQR